MNYTRTLPLAMALVVALAACGKQEAGAPAEADGGASTAEAGAGDEQPQADAPAAAAAEGFDITQVPLSEVALGEFPYVNLPEGYTSERRRTFDKAFARFPFWVKGQPVWVEGRFYGAAFVPVDGKSMSEYEVKKNFEGLVTQLGGVKLSEEEIPNDTIDAWGKEITQGFNGGLGDVWSEPTATYLVRRNDGNLWIHLVTNTSQGWYVVGREKGFEQTASLVPASELKSQIDKDGKVALQVNFDTGKTQILAGSLPQIEQVAKLLADDPSLRLAINGHTDNVGQADANRSLSEGRAKAVVEALAARGIDAGRLSAAGFGDSQPVADNGSEAGRAQNRRVELVKR